MKQPKTALLLMACAAALALPAAVQPADAVLAVSPTCSQYGHMITVTWAANPGAAKYTIELSKNPGGVPTLISTKTTTAPTTTTTFNIEQKIPYTVEVQARNADNSATGRDSGSADITCEGFAISASCDASSPTITVTWPAIPDGYNQYTLEVRERPSNAYPVFDYKKTTPTTSTGSKTQYNTNYEITARFHDSTANNPQLNSSPVPISCDWPFELSHTCGNDGLAVSWPTGPPGTAGYTVNYGNVYVDTAATKYAPSTIPGNTDHTFTVTAIRGNTLPLVVSQPHAVNCPNDHAPVVWFPNGTWGYNPDVNLSAGYYDNDGHDVSLEWSCKYGDKTVPITRSTTATYITFRMPDVPIGTEITCTIRGSDPYGGTGTDTITITADGTWDGTGPWDGAPRGSTGTTSFAQDLGGDVPAQTAQSQTTTRTTGGGSGGGFGSFAFIPTQSRSEPEPEPEPEQYVPAITNGTIPYVKFRAVPLNATVWYGGTTTPLQCDILPTGHVNATLQYLGMEPSDIHISNITHANATDTTPATYNMTIHAIPTYNMTEIGTHGALYQVAANDIVWSIYPDTLAAFHDIFDDTTVLAITQYGTVHWTAADGACRAP